MPSLPQINLSLGGFSTLKLILVPLVLTISLGAITNAALNSNQPQYQYSSDFKITNVILNQQSPFTYLATGDFGGFINSLFADSSAVNFGGNPRPSGTTVLPSALQSLTNCVTRSFEQSSGGITVIGRVIDCTGIPKSWSFPVSKTGLVEFSCNTSTTAKPLTTDTFCNANLQTTTTIYNFGCTTDGTNWETATSSYSMDCIPKTSFVIPHPNLLTVLASIGSVFLPVIEFFGGILLIVLSLGVQFSGGVATASGSIGANTQGTKQAQVFGVGLLLWGLVASELGTVWNVFPWGLGIVLGFVFESMFFLGLWRQTQSWI